MNNSIFSLALIGVVPATCDAEAGEGDRLSTDTPLGDVALDCVLAEGTGNPKQSKFAPDSSRPASRFRPI